MTQRYRCVMLFGPPGVGKGTQGKRLGAVDGFIHLATGDIFRALPPDSPEGRRFKEFSSKGQLVPDEFTVQLFRKHVATMVASGGYDPRHDLLLLDGIPRSRPQSEMLDATLEPLAILHFIARDLDALVQRIMKRGQDEGRADDQDENVVRDRFQVYERQTKPVLEHYDAKLVHDIDPMGSIDEVHGRVLEVLDPIRRRFPGRVTA